MEEFEYTYGFDSDPGLDPSSAVPAAASVGRIRLYPVEGASDPDVGGFSPPSEGWLFSQYLTKATVETSASQQFGEEMEASTARYRCAYDYGEGVSSTWILFFADGDEGRTQFHVPDGASDALSMWNVDIGPDGAMEAVRIATGGAVSLPAVDEDHGFTRFAYTVAGKFAIYGEHLVARRSFSPASESQSRYTGPGFLQKGTRGVASSSDGPRMAGFVVQLNKDGKVDRSMLYDNVDIEQEMDGERRSRELADDSLRNAIESHSGDRSNPHRVTGAQIVADVPNELRFIPSAAYLNGKKIATEESVSGMVGAIGGPVQDNPTFTVGGERVGFVDIVVEGRRYSVLAKLDGAGSQVPGGWSPVVQGLRVMDASGDGEYVDVSAEDGVLRTVGGSIEG